MDCPQCQQKLRSVKVKVEGAKESVLSHQCLSCDYSEFEKKSAEKVLAELRA